MIWFSSDYHFCHDKPFIYEPRGFPNIHEMNETIVANHNNLVAPEDDIYILGDLMLNNDEDGMKYISQLKGNLHIIQGNHDTDKRRTLYDNLHNVVEMAEALYLKYKGHNFFLTHYPCLTGNVDRRHALINLCGHTHIQDRFFHWDKYENSGIYHVEVDAHECCPVSIDQIIEDMKGIK